jgi:hypothetical protein
MIFFLFTDGPKALNRIRVGSAKPVIAPPRFSWYYSLGPFVLLTLLFALLFL